MHDLAPNSPEARDVANLIHPFTNPSVHEEIGPFIVDRAEGVHIYDTDGNRYIEGMAGLCCVGLGWGEERLVQAAAEQMRRLSYCQNFAHRSHNPGIDLAERLVAMAPKSMSKAFFGSSGSEANDSAVKIAWFYNDAHGKPEKRKLIAQRKGYHGVTVAAGSLTGLPHVHKGFGMPLPGFLHVETPHYFHGAEPGESEDDYSNRLADQLEALILDEGPETVAAFIAEPVLASGGMIVPPKDYLQKVQGVLRRHDVLFIVDEVICGFGRTGNMFACETFGLEPDMLVLAKQLSSAYLPISALVVNQKIYDGLKRGGNAHGMFGSGFTYSGHPVTAAVANETLDIYEERDIVGHAAAMGEHLLARLGELVDHPLVGEVRGVGMMVGVELVRDKATHENFDPSHKVGAHCMERCQVHGLISRGMANDTMGLSPPLVITRAQLDEAIDALIQAIDETEDWVRAEGLR